MKKEKSITIRLDDKIIEEIKKKSKNLNMNISGYVRFCVENAIKDNYIPKAKVVWLLHDILSDSDLQKNQKIKKIAKELYEKWI